MILRKVTVLTCLCSITFYLTSSVVDETEAGFTEQEVATSMITAAVVFPETIDELVKEAEKLSTRLNDTYDHVLHVALDGLTINQTEAKLEEVQGERKEIKSHLQSLRDIYDKVKEYVERARTSDLGEDSHKYVQAGLNKIQKLFEKASEREDSPQLDRVITALQEELGALKQKHEESGQPSPAIKKQSETTNKKTNDQKQTTEEPVPQKDQSTKRSTTKAESSKESGTQKAESTKDTPTQKNESIKASITQKEQPTKEAVPQKQDKTSATEEQSESVEASDKQEESKPKEGENDKDDEENVKSN
ncbi:DUF4047 domain-containing protein [Halobacillus shinanisalinarum]|uniref:DUF4047 domain-containing protein n=1 Tax=Halobacillus shinanisalinarum TaxID=2932258 RepID=A0ABY4H6N9_9BACI|nr:DUF4047 domain-containing protein [Halobacillus shinanisalinarum]UOQ94657.1 DUF4047 domain-containing protein [Halobacillus shinanisalinarum]